MKNVKILIFLCCAAVLGSAFSYARPAAAHSDDPHQDSGLVATASDVSNGQTLENFVKHAAAHLQESRSFQEATQLLYEFRNTQGDWHNDSVFLVLLTSGGGVYVHANNRNLEDQDWSGLADAGGSNVGMMFFAQQEGFVGYSGSDGTARQSYAFSFSAPSIPLSNPLAPERQEFVLIGGFDYEPPAVSDKASYEQLAASYDLPQFSPTVEARDVDTREDLVQFVEEAILFFTRALAAGGGNVSTGGDGVGSDNIDVVLLRRIFRLEGGPWREGSTYTYIMENEGNVIFNGANRNIEQTNILDSAADSPELQVALQELIDVGIQGGGFVEYDWDDPNVIGDEPQGGGPGGGSPKLGYAKAIQINKDSKDAEPVYYVFGSGIHLGQQAMEPEPEPEVEPESEGGGGGGCAISHQTGGYAPGAFLSLFVVLSCVFSFALIRRRG